MPTVDGVDVAKYQAANYSTRGLAFVFVKATEGHTYVNPKHGAQVAHGRAAGLVVGHYHFVRPGAMAEQAAYFLAHARPRAGDILCLDWEDRGVSGAEKDEFLHTVQAARPGNRLVLYCNLDFWRNLDHTSFAADGLWIADPSAPKGEPRVQHPWLFHQHSIRGGTDQDTANFADRAALHRWAAGTSTPEDTLADLTPRDVWRYRHQAADTLDTYGHLVQTHAAVTALTAQVAAVTAALTALARDGGLTAEQITAAAKAGADAALAELGSVLTDADDDGAPPDEPAPQS